MKSADHGSEGSANSVGEHPNRLADLWLVRFCCSLRTSEEVVREAVTRSNWACPQTGAVTSCIWLARRWSGRLPRWNETGALVSNVARQARGSPWSRGPALRLGVGWSAAKAVGKHRRIDAAAAMILVLAPLDIDLYAGMVRVLDGEGGKTRTVGTDKAAFGGFCPGRG
ncbi:MAG: hypothetical protein JSU86_18480 [Phycisphaerales bacterium]|nr:MAG: hypothetical protein JSU86_18480 [Phycisphaerales bacterium]